MPIGDGGAGTDGVGLGGAVTVGLTDGDGDLGDGSTGEGETDGLGVPLPVGLGDGLGDGLATGLGLPVLPAAVTGRGLVTRRGRAGWPGPMTLTPGLVGASGDAVLAPGSWTGVVFPGSAATTGPGAAVGVTAAGRLTVPAGAVDGD